MIIDVPHEFVLILGQMIGVLFVASGFLKIYKFKDFQNIVKNYSIVPENLADLAAYLILVSEAIVGVLLIGTVAISVVAVVAFAMVAIYTIGLVRVILRNVKMKNCGCFGFLVKIKPSWTSVGLNLLILFCLMILI